MIDLAAVAAPNGLGHFRRVVRQLDGLLTARPRLQLGLVCTTAQLDATADWAPLQRVRAAAQLDTSVLASAFVWSTDPAAYDDERLWGWASQLEQLSWFTSARKVLSDNLAGVLEVRADAALGGSFLWSDVLAPLQAANPELARFVRRERELLATHRPPMLCVGDVAMPGVREQTRAVAVGWPCEWSIDRPAAGAPGKRVAVLGGATDAVAARLEPLVRALLGAGLEVATEPRLKSARFPQEPRVLPFAHGQGDYAALSLAVVRPGIGTLTDCVGAQVPMLILDEPQNVEMAHNAEAMKRTGVAELLAQDGEVASRALACLAPGRWSGLVAAHRRRSRDGLRRAVDWLANWVGA